MVLVAVLVTLSFAGLGAYLRLGAGGQGVNLSRLPVVLVEHGHEGHDQNASFTIAAPSITGLYPGVSRPLNLTVTNPNRKDIKVISIAGAVTRTSRSGCRVSASNITVGTYGGSPKLPYVVKAGTAARLGYLMVTMPRSAADACARTTFTISFTGSAEGRS